MSDKPEPGKMPALMGVPAPDDAKPFTAEMQELLAKWRTSQNEKVQALLFEAYKKTEAHFAYLLVTMPPDRNNDAAHFDAAWMSDEDADDLQLSAWVITELATQMLVRLAPDGKDIVVKVPELGTVVLTRDEEEIDDHD